MKMNKTLWILLICAGLMLAAALAPPPAVAVQRSGDSFAFMGVWTPLRFNRGALDDFIPPDWDLGFFEKEREGLNRCIKYSYSTMLPDDMGYDMVPPAHFERLSHDIYRKVYTSFNIDDVNQRYNWAAVDDYAEMLNVRYAMFGDVTALDATDLNNVKLEMFIIVYDSLTNQVVYLQQFANSGRMAQELPASTLRRAHPKMDEDMIWFLRTPLGRAALIVYDDFANTLTGDVAMDFVTGAAQPDISDPTVGIPPTQPIAAPTLQKEFEMTPACSEKGASLIVSNYVGNNHILVFTCQDGKLKLKQSKPGVYPGYPRGLWSAVGQFMGRGQASLAVAPVADDDDVRVYGVDALQIDFSQPAQSFFNLFGVNGSYAGGVFTAAGDFDGDGLDELILSITSQINELAIFNAEIGPQSVFASMQFMFDGLTFGVYPSAGDFDGDGIDELAVSPLEVNDHIRIYKVKNGTITTSDLFAELYDFFPNYTQGCFTVTGDFDGDGVDELAAVRAHENSGVVIFKFINGKFEQVDYVEQAIPGYAAGTIPAAGDFDGDGRDELLLAKSSGNDEIYIFRFVNGKLDTASPMGIVKDIYLNYNNLVLPSAGNIPQFRAK